MRKKWYPDYTSWPPAERNLSTPANFDVKTIANYFEILHCNKKDFSSTETITKSKPMAQHNSYSILCYQKVLTWACKTSSSLPIEEIDYKFL